MFGGYQWVVSVMEGVQFVGEVVVWCLVFLYLCQGLWVGGVLLNFVVQFSIFGVVEQWVVVDGCVVVYEYVVCLCLEIFGVCELGQQY